MSSKTLKTILLGLLVMSWGNSFARYNLRSLESPLPLPVSDSELYEKSIIIVEGDIAVRVYRDEDGAIVESAADRKATKWPNGVIPYIIAPRDRNNTRMITAIKNAMDVITEKTNLRFKKRTSERDYVRFTSENNGCYSFVGRWGGAQDINLSRGCWLTYTVAHEIFHAAGVHHEQSRSDRDEHIDVRWNNIPRRLYNNFRLVESARHGSYDIRSIMQYGSYAFSKNGQPTMVTKSGEIIRENRSHLTQSDIAGINALYPYNRRPQPDTDIDIDIDPGIDPGTPTGPTIPTRPRVKPFSTRDIGLVFYTSGRNHQTLNVYLRADRSKLRRIKSVTYQVSSLGTKTIHTRDKDFLLGIRNRKNDYRITAVFNLTDGQKFKKTWNHDYIKDTGMKLYCQIRIDRKESSPVYEIDIYPSRSQAYEHTFEHAKGEARIMAYFNFNTDSLELSMFYERKRHFLSRRRKQSFKRAMARSSSEKIRLKRSELVCSYYR